MSGAIEATRADRSEEFDRYRPLLFSIAYRMLGSVMDAEDMVQEAYLRWMKTGERGAENAEPGDEIESPKAYLSAIVSRLCIDHLRSARTRREQYVGPWLPEPLVGEVAEDPAERVALADSLSMAFLVLLERLGPRERAAFLLREVFDYDYPEVARILGTSEANCRQLVRRARQHLGEGRPRFAAEPEQGQRLAEQFGRAVGRGDVDGLLALLAENVTTYSDGGGVVAAARRPVEGAAMVARFLTGLMRNAPPDTRLVPTTVNGGPGLVTLVGGQVANAIALDVAEGRIRNVYIVVNPEKLRAVEPPPPQAGHGPA